MSSGRVSVGFGEQVVYLEFVLAFLGRGAKDLDFAQVALAHSGLGHGGQVHDLLGIEAHQFRGEGIHGEWVEAGKGEACINGRSVAGAVAFHGSEAVNHTEVRIDLLGEVEHVVVQYSLATVVVLSVRKPLVVFLVVVQGRRQQDVLQRQGGDDAVVGLHLCGGDDVQVRVEKRGDDADRRGAVAFAEYVAVLVWLFVEVDELDVVFFFEGQIAVVLIAVECTLF